MSFARMLIVAFFMLIAYATPASALVTNVTPVPDLKNVTFGPAATITVSWRIDRTTAGGPVQLRSPAGRFRVVNTVVATSPARQKLVSGNPASIVFFESVTVPQVVLRAALELNNGQFVYERDFADDPPANTFFTGAMDVVVTGGMGGPLSFAEVTMKFDNGATFTTVPERSPLRAQARIRSNGSGQMTAVWEVSGNSSDTFFRPIRTVSIGLSGQRFITETSPPLPTTSEGRYNVRFRVISPTGSDIRPVITYFVTPGGKQVAQGAIEASTPPADANVAKGTVFDWKAVKGAAVYRLQMLDAGGGVAASMLVRGTQGSLNDFVLAQLQGPATYQWRVIALNAEGDVIGSSAPRSIKVKGK